MKLLPLMCVASLLIAGSMAQAQQPPAGKGTAASPPTNGQKGQPNQVNAQPAVTLQAPLHSAHHFAIPNVSAPAVTPELWVYSQEWRRHDDPAEAVRRKAEMKADQRLSRLGAMKWFGFSNARPQASTTPFMGVYSPAWIGNGWDRYDWAGVGSTNNVVRVETYEVRR